MPDPEFIVTPEGQRLRIETQQVPGFGPVRMVRPDDVPRAIGEAARTAGATDEAIQAAGGVAATAGRVAGDVARLGERVGVVPQGGGAILDRVGEEAGRLIRRPAETAADAALALTQPGISAQAVLDVRAGMQAAEGVAASQGVQPPAPLGDGEGVRFSGSTSSSLGEVVTRTIPGDPEVGPADAAGLRGVAADARARAEDQAGQSAAITDDITRLQEEAADELDRVNDDFGIRQAEAKAAADEAVASFRQQLAGIEAGQIDPNRWWGRQDTGARLMSIAATTLAGLGGFFKGDGSNPVLARIEAEIDADLDVQERDLGRAERAQTQGVQGAQTLMQYFFREQQQIPAARESAAAVAMSSFAQRIRGLAEESQDIERQRQLLQFAEQLEFRAEEREFAGLQAIANINAQRRRRARTVTRIRTQDGRLITPSEAQGDPQALRFISTEMRKIAPAQDAARRLRGSLSQFGEDIPGVGRGIRLAEALSNPSFVQFFSSPEGRLVRQRIGNLFAQFIRAVSGAQAAEAEVERLQSIVSGSMTPAEVREGLSIVQSSLGAIEETIAAADPVSFEAFQRNRAAARRRGIGRGPDVPSVRRAGEGQ